MTHLVSNLSVLLTVSLDLLTYLSAFSATKVIYDSSLSECEALELFLHPLIDLLSQGFDSSFLISLLCVTEVGLDLAFRIL